MAIAIHIAYSGAPGQAQRFAREMTESGAVRAIREEEGNLKYAYFLPMEEDHTVLLVDIWADQAALDRHHHSPMMEKIVQLREKYGLHMTVERYLSDEAGVPQQDQAYIVP